MSAPAVVDVHTHVLPAALIELARAGELALEVRDGDGTVLVLPSGFEHPVEPVFADVAAKLAQMDADGIDAAVVSTSPSLILPLVDGRPPAAADGRATGGAAALCRAANDALAAFAAAAGGRLHALASVPLADPPAAAEELLRARRELGMVGAQIGTSVGEVALDAPELEPFFAAAERERMPVLLHPYLSMVEAPRPGLERFHLANVIGNPFETFVAAARLIVGGVLDRHPDLVVVLVHGGGSLPYQLGRLAHACAARPDGARLERGSAAAYADRFLYDTVVFDSRALDFLLALAGPERIVLGTDIPFDMADRSALDHLASADPDVARAVLAGNARRAFGLDR